MPTQIIIGYVFISALFIASIMSWLILIRGKFKASYMFPCTQPDCFSKARKWFLIQSVFLFLTGIISIIRLSQLTENHSDNVIENLMFAISSLLFFRVIGDFKIIGLFRTESNTEFAHNDKKLLTPIFAVLFLLSLSLLI